MHKQGLFFFHTQLVYVMHALAQQIKTLDVRMELYTPEAKMKPLPQDGNALLFPREHSCHPCNMGIGVTQICHETIQPSSNPRPVSILMGHDVRYPSLQQKSDRFRGFQSVSNRPAELLKPLPDRGEDVVGKEMDMGIDHRGQAFRHSFALNIIQGGKRSFHKPRLLFSPPPLICHLCRLRA